VTIRNKDRNAVSWHVRAAGREDFTGCGVPTSTVVGRVVHDLSGYPHDEQCGNCRRARAVPQRRNVHELVPPTTDAVAPDRTLCGMTLQPSTLHGAASDVTCGSCKRLRVRDSKRLRVRG
jgi:hypothetical protein